MMVVFCGWARPSRTVRHQRCLPLLFMVIIGGLGSLIGAYLGAA
jgi:ABC-type branched-subunit amino acid transport system permease subunit